MKLVTHPEVRRELDDAAHYFSNIDSELTEDLLNKYEEELEHIAANPLIYRVRSNGFRRANLDRFPYYLPFFVKDDSIHILAFAHHSRRPNYWIHRTSL